ncbi:universal stress protein [Polaribacter glomeratus]|uniref:Universal stress protein n=1 Tax=Polaribacter glomeratus TaxID=102 RepID=A0A2S7WHC0_9FLAO|nr:universal stress protein [Polaribacter glomeratus]PQJ76662.1 universal stress protein [Polaribacter glomeratus]TXD67499.1 universal stress protein [Polaribacter glomeratus]
MKNILLPTDFSDNSWNAIVYALNFYKDANCNFYLLHVSKLSTVVTNDYPYVPAQGIIEDVYIKPTKKQLRAVLKKISENFPKNKKHNFYTLTDYNFFIESLREHLEEKKVDVIVMGTKGASGLSKLIIGSNTGDVITKVKCTTLVVPENAKFIKIEEIAFPTDFSLSNDLQILQPIAEILEENNASLRVLNISKKSLGLNIDQQKNKELLEDYFYNHKHSFHFLTNKKVEDAIQCFVESRDIDMIAMVAKNLNYFQQILFHTKVEEISYHTDVPFLVLHE